MSLNYSVKLSMLDRMTAPVRSLSRQWDGLRQNISATERQVARFRQQMDKSLQRASNLTVAGTGAVVFGKKMTEALGKPAGVAMDFEAAMSKVQALTRLDLRNPAQLQHFRDLREQAQQLGDTTSFTASDVAGGQGFLAMAGFDPEKIMATMPGLLSLSKAGDVGLARTADISSNILSGFSLQADQMARLGDVMAYTFTTSNVNLEMLGDTMKYVAPVASKAGSSIEEVAAMVGALGDVGIQGSMAGTALRAAFLRLAKEPKMTADALDRLGVSAKTSTGDMLPMVKILENLNERMQGMGSGEQLEMVAAIFGQEAAAGMTELVMNISKVQGKLSDINRESAGTAKRIAAVMSDNLRGSVKETKSAIEGLMITIGNHLLPQLREKTQTITKIVRRVQAWVKENSALSATLITLSTKFAAAIAGMGALLIGMAAIIGPVAVLRYGFRSLWVRAGLLGRSFGLLGLAAAGAIGVMLGWKQLQPLVDKYFPALGEWLGERIPARIEGFKAAWQELNKALAGTNHWDSRLQQFRSIFAMAFGIDPITVYQAALERLDGFWQRHSATVQSLLGRLRAALGAFFSAIGQWMDDNQGRIQVLMDVLALALFAKLGLWLGRLETMSKNGSLAAWLDNLGARLKPVLKGIGAFFAGLWAGFKAAGKFVIWLKNFVGGWENLGKIAAVGYILTFFSTFFVVLSAIVGMTTGIIAIIATLAKVVFWVTKFAVAMKLAAGVMVLLRGAKLLSFLALLASRFALGKVAVVAFRIALFALGGPIGWIIGLVTAVIAIWKNWDAIVGWLNEKFPTLTQWLGEAIPNSINAAITWIKDLFGWLEKALNMFIDLHKKAFEFGMEWGKDVINSVTNIFSDDEPAAAPAGTKTLPDIAQTLKTESRSTLDVKIHSDRPVSVERMESDAGTTMNVDTGRTMEAW